MSEGVSISLIDLLQPHFCAVQVRTYMSLCFCQFCVRSLGLALSNDSSFYGRVYYLYCQPLLFTFYLQFLYCALLSSL